MKRTLALLLTLLLTLTALLSGCTDSTVNEPEEGTKATTEATTEATTTAEATTTTEATTEVTTTTEATTTTVTTTTEATTTTVATTTEATTTTAATEAQDEKDLKSIVGKWGLTMNITEFGMDLFDLGPMADYIDVDELTFTVIFEFAKDGTCKYYVDEQSIRDYVNTVKSATKAYLEDTIAALEMGDDGTELFLQSMGVSSLDEYVDLMLDTDMMVEAFNEEVAITGEYRIENGKLYIDESGFVDEVGLPYELDGDTLSLTELGDFGTLEFVKMK